jgi:hypothetical protein
VDKRSSVRQRFHAGAHEHEQLATTLLARADEVIE